MLVSRLVPALAGALLWALPEAHATTSGAPRARVHSIIVHAISGPSCRGGQVVFSGAPGDAERWKRFFDRHPFLAIHYVVDREGTALSSTPEGRQANHALGNNEGTIGIELVHNGDGIEPFGDKQIEALIRLLRSIRGRHDIPVANIKGHGDVDRRTFSCGGRTVKGRSDPGANFPWARVRAALRGGEEPAVAAAPASRGAAGALPKLLAEPRLIHSAPATMAPPPFALGGPARESR